ncbi:MgtC/SapB family protein [Nanoarchaeota archaeon]
MFETIYLNEYLVQLGQLFIAIILGGIIGLERQERGIAAGLRTHMIVSLAGCFMMIIASELSGTDPNARIIAGILTGIGFLGAGTIISTAGSVKGLTTAATIWATVGIGIIIGLEKFFLGIAAALLIWGILKLKSFEVSLFCKPQSIESDESEGIYHKTASKKKKKR